MHDGYVCRRGEVKLHRGQFRRVRVAHGSFAGYRVFNAARRTFAFHRIHSRQSNHLEVRAHSRVRRV